MAKRKPENTKNLVSHTKDEGLCVGTDREDKIMNSMANVSVILMGMMMGAFSQVMSKAVGGMASGLAEAFGGEEAGVKVNEEVKKGMPELDGKMKGMILEIRKDVYVQMAQKRKEMKPLLSDPAFDVGPRIIEKYDFKLPKLSQELDDDSLARYSKLLADEDPGFVEMFKELTEWINALPKPPEQMSGKSKKGALGKRRQIKK